MGHRYGNCGSRGASITSNRPGPGALRRTGAHTPTSRHGHCRTAPRQCNNQSRVVTNRARNGIRVASNGLDGTRAGPNLFRLAERLGCVQRVVRSPWVGMIDHQPCLRGWGRGGVRGEWHA